MKVCRVCEKEKEEVDFRKHRRVCKKCLYKQNREWISKTGYYKRWYEENYDSKKESNRKKEYYAENKEILNRKSSEYYRNNIEYIKDKHKEWYENNKDKRKISMRLWHEKEMRENYKYVVKLRLRSLLRQALRRYGHGKTQSSSKYGINYSNIIEQLGECPGNISDYHVDHIIPLCAFDLSDPLHVKAAFAPQNHRWVKKEDNLSKGGAYDSKEFEKYMESFRNG